MPSTRIFFFQAEDGIRDLTVTGVQTCALPILRQRWLQGRERRETLHVGRHRVGAEHGQLAQQTRSEERRVGKECRSRWPPYERKNKAAASRCGEPPACVTSPSRARCRTDPRCRRRGFFFFKQKTAYEI